MPQANPLQEIPRPPTWRHGAPAPWADLPVGERTAVTLGRVLDALEGHGQAGPPPEGMGLERVLHQPDLDVMPEAPPHRPNAGVLVVLFEEHGDTRVILTRRSSRLRTHTNEISFPGGRLDRGEEPSDAARRETHEEIGLDPALVSLVGWLHPVVVPRSVSLIMPLVATVPGRPDLVANPSEVDRVFDVALAELAAPATFHEEWWSVPERRPFPVWFFEIAGEVIWGATARMLHELVSIVLTEDREI